MKQRYDVAARILTLRIPCAYCVFNTSFLMVQILYFYIASVYLQCCNGASDGKFPSDIRALAAPK